MRPYCLTRSLVVIELRGASVLMGGESQAAQS
jgi:hypothetical protein